MIPKLIHRFTSLAFLFWAVACASAMDLETAKALAISAPRVEYPTKAQAKGITGSGLYLMTINEKGLVTSVTVASTSGHKILDKQAVTTLKRWRFRPGTVTKINMPVTWTL